MKSLYSDEKKCIICGRTNYDGIAIHKHHIFFGTANRKKSDEWGCWCYLCYKHHTGSTISPHDSHAVDLKLKKDCQMRFEKKYGHDKFMEIFHRNYLD